jgi:hypothetical protein
VEPTGLFEKAQYERARQRILEQLTRREFGASARRAPMARPSDLGDQPGRPWCGASPSNQKQVA